MACVIGELAKDGKRADDTDPCEDAWVLSLPKTRAGRATLDALLAIALWSTLAVLGIRLRHVPPFMLVGVSLLLGAACGARGISLKVRPAVLALGVYGLFLYHLCLFLSFRLAPPIEANLVQYLWPLLIVVLAPVFVKGTPLRFRHVAGALLGFSGAALLVSGGRLGFSREGTTGYLFAFAAAVIWSTYSLGTKRLGSFPTSTVATFCLVSGLLALLCHALFEPSYVPQRGDLLFFALLGLGPMGAAFYLWDRALKGGDPRVVGTLAYLTPLFSTALVAAFGGGTLGRKSLVAMALIVGGAVVGTRVPKNERAPEEETARTTLG